ncbi:MAG: molybdate ABC transporter permease subunit [Flavobacteriaceae bacterium]|nr:MAG: molybdate ABC transporter permease subunit [Flavobacteriaceae bacterium]
MIDWSPLLITFKLAFITTICLIILGIPLAYWLAYTKNKLKAIIETLVSMPLVLPPTVLGFYFLIAFSPQNAFGNWLDTYWGIHLIFSFEGLIIGSIIYSLPFMVHPIQAGFSSVPKNLLEASQLLGKSKFTTLTSVLLPSIKSSLITGIVLSFAHTIGEFGLVLMIGGNIPNKTKVASIAIYEEVESLNYAAANSYSLILFTITFIILLMVYLLNNKSIKNIF